MPAKVAKAAGKINQPPPGGQACSHHLSVLVRLPVQLVQMKQCDSFFDVKTTVGSLLLYCVTRSFFQDFKKIAISVWVGL